jgi:hypothetical protein
MTKTLDEYFRDWEGYAFGFGYGTGEEHTLAALKAFMGEIGKQPERPNGYDYRALEAALTPTVAWLMINALCQANVIEYGTSPRGGWLTPAGSKLKEFVDHKTVEQLVEICCSRTEGSYGCSPSHCNCGDRTVEGPACPNPFFDRH